MLATPSATTPPTTVDEDRALAHLHARLTARAQEVQLLDVAYRFIESPIGRLLIASTPRGVVRLAFESESVDDVLTELASRVGPRVLEAPRPLDGAAQELDEYFSHSRSHFDVPVDFTLSRGYRREVLAHLTTIPFGRTESYTEVAAATGNPKAVRAVGSACATNPLPVIVPCHRVLRSDGSLGGYRGGLAAKRMLLDLEAAG